MKLALIGRGGTYQLLARETGVPKWGRGVSAEVLLNYGLGGERMFTWQRRNPRGNRLPMINRSVGASKFEVIDRVKVLIPCPESSHIINIEDDFDDWLVKPYYSSGGRGITVATDNCPHRDKYYQRRVRDRRYELRVHAFRWMPTDAWVVQKRVGDADEVTWNHHTGGRFITVQRPEEGRVFLEARESSLRVLETLGMGFGAVDFIVDHERVVWFIEINARPGVSGLSDIIYINAVKALEALSKEEVMGYATTTTSVIR